MSYFCIQRYEDIFALVDISYNHLSVHVVDPKIKAMAGVIFFEGSGLTDVLDILASMSISINWLKIEEAAAAKAHPITVWVNSHQLIFKLFDLVARIKPTTVVTITKKLSLALVKSNKSLRVNSLPTLGLFESVTNTINYLRSIIHQKSYCWILKNKFFEAL